MPNSSALLDRAPVQTQIELQGDQGSFAGIAVAALAQPSRNLVRDLIASLLSTYAPDDVAYARQCLDGNGGIASLHLSYYREGKVDHSRHCQIFRLEGPAAVFYFRGAPHLHAFINIAMDGNAPLSVGEVVGNNPALIEGMAVKELFERAMRAHTSCDYAYYPADSVVGRLRTGVIRSGDIYNLESWQERIVVAEVKGESLPESVVVPDVRRTYSVATTAYAARGWSIESEQSSVMLRDAVIEFMRAGGLSSLL